MQHTRSSINGIFILENNGIPNTTITDFGENIKHGSLCVDTFNDDLFILKDGIGWVLIAGGGGSNVIYNNGLTELNGTVGMGGTFDTDIILSSPTNNSFEITNESDKSFNYNLSNGSFVVGTNVSNSSGINSVVLGNGSTIDAGNNTFVFGNNSSNISGNHNVVMGANNHNYGGSWNVILGEINEIVGGGGVNSILGGYHHRANGNQNTILGGYDSRVAQTNNSFIAGIGLDAGTFIFVDVTFSGGKFYFDGVEAPVYPINNGYCYRFITKDSSNSGHPLRFSTTPDGIHQGGEQLTRGVKLNGGGGGVNHYSEFIPYTNGTFYYYDTNNSSAGNSLTVTSGTTKLGNVVMGQASGNGNGGHVNFNRGTVNTSYSMWLSQNDGTSLPYTTGIYSNNSGVFAGRNVRIGEGLEYAVMLGIDSKEAVAANTTHVENLHVFGNDITLDKFGTNGQGGTAVYALGVDITGKVVETSLSGTSGGTLVYDSELDDAIESPGIEVPVGTTVGDIRGMSFTDFIDTYVFPTVLSSISSNKSSLLTFNIGGGTVEVGTLLDPILTATFNRGSIQNGDGSGGLDLVGVPNTFTFTGDGITPSVVVASTNLIEAIDTSNPNFTAHNAIFGANSWNVLINHDAGSGTYFDSKGNPDTSLDGSRIAGSSSDNSNTITGRYYAFRDTGFIPVNSADVRSTASKSFLSASNTGSFNISIPSNTPEVWFAVPTGKSATVLYVESSNADVTGTFSVSTFNVNDASGSPVSYDIWSSTIGGGGYPSVATYSVSIT